MKEQILTIVSFSIPTFPINYDKQRPLAAMFVESVEVSSSQKVSDLGFNLNKDSHKLGI